MSKINKVVVKGVSYDIEDAYARRKVDNSFSSILANFNNKSVDLDFGNDNNPSLKTISILNANGLRAGVMSAIDYSYLQSLNYTKELSIEFTDSDEKIHLSIMEYPFIPKGVRIEIVSDTITTLRGYTEDYSKEFTIKDGYVTEDDIAILQNFEVIGKVTIKYTGAIKELGKELIARIQGKSKYNNPLDDIVYLGNFGSYHDLIRKLETLHSEDPGEAWDYCGLFTATIQTSSRVFIMNSCTSFEDGVWQQSIIGNVQVVETQDELDFYSHGMSIVHRYRKNGSWSEWENIGGGSSAVAELIQEVTYSELVALRDTNQLVAGTKYRITDYVTTTVQKDTMSANHPFDVIVEAISENELSELAQAIQHEGDTYFEGNDLGAWQLWYDLDNNTDKYEWADAENGKGVIYRMIDEKRNDCPYDFKNILFYTKKYTDNTTTDKYYYTFSYVVNNVLYDGTVEKKITACYSNSMGVYYTNNKRTLNKNTFLNNYFFDYCYSNKFGDYCYLNVFNQNCHSNKFGDYFFENMLGMYFNLNTFGNYCHLNSFFYDTKFNIFGNNCYNNGFDSHCNNNIFGNNCYNNSLNLNCSFNTFGNYCFNNVLFSDCNNNILKDGCHSIKLDHYIHNRTFDNSNTSITLNEEYYDDGTNKLVPIKHPDLSTQPSILPYKFMGQYVYEQLIPNIELTNSCDIQNTFVVKKPLIISANSIGGNASEDASPRWWIDENTFNIETLSVADFMNVKFFRIVYTSMPEEGDNSGYNYGYNNY